MEKRAGRFSNGTFTDHDGGSLIQDRALLDFPQELVNQDETNVVAFRSSLPLFGIGFVEALSNNTLQGFANGQSSSQRGQVINVPVLERPTRSGSGDSATRVSRPASFRSRRTPM